LLLGLAALGPLGALLAGWSLAAAPRERRETVAAWSFLAPSALLLVAFTAGPLLFALYLSVHRVSPVAPGRPFIGLAGYAHALGSPLVWAALGRTLLYAGYVPVSMGLALALALLVRGRSWGATVVRTLFLVPAVSSVVAVALVWRWMYQPDVGVINHLLGPLLGHSVDWLGDPGVSLIALMIVSVSTRPRCSHWSWFSRGEARSAAPMSWCIASTARTGSSSSSAMPACSRCCCSRSC